MSFKLWNVPATFNKHRFRSHLENLLIWYLLYIYLYILYILLLYIYFYIYLLLYLDDMIIFGKILIKK